MILFEENVQQQLTKAIMSEITRTMRKRLQRRKTQQSQTIDLSLTPQILKELIKTHRKNLKVRYDFLHVPFKHSGTFQSIRKQLKYMTRTSGIYNFTLTELQFCHGET